MESTIVDDLRQRRPQALDRLLAEHGREIQAVAYLILRDRDDASDVLAETLETAWERASSIRNPGALRPWLLRVATNRALSRRRSQGRVVTLESVPEPSADDLARDVSIRLSLSAAVATLPPRTRAAVALRYYADLSVEDVAAAMGTRPNTVKTQLREALTRLRAALDERQGAPLEREALRG